MPKQEPLDIRFGDNYQAVIEITLRCRSCSNKGEPSVPQFDVTASAWTETARTVAIPCHCPDCGDGMTLLVQLP
jgi:hypothetical protein